MSGGATPRLVQHGTDALAALVAKYAGRDEPLAADDAARSSG